MQRRRLIELAVLLLTTHAAWAQPPAALDAVYIPDYSWAGYRHGEAQPTTDGWTVVDVAQHGIAADDGIDDTRALNALLQSLAGAEDPVVLQFGTGRYEISDIIHINRSRIVLRGAGAGAGPTASAVIGERAVRWLERILAEGDAAKDAEEAGADIVVDEEITMGEMLSRRIVEHLNDESGVLIACRLGGQTPK